MLTNIIVIILLVMLNAYFAGSKMALVSINDNKIRLMADAGDKKAASVKKLLDEPGKFLSTIQIGITLAGFLSSAFASDAFADKLAAWVLSLGVPVSYNVIKHVSMIAITLILSYFTLVFGELLPAPCYAAGGKSVSKSSRSSACAGCCNFPSCEAVDCFY